jgi:hypothetical protein
MNWDWTVIKERAQEIFAKVSQMVVFQLACFYVLACVVASGPVGPKDFVGFIYHCFQWEPPVHDVATPTASKVR